MEINTIPISRTRNFTDVKAFCDKLSTPDLQMKPKFILEKTQHEYEKWLLEVSN